MGAPKQREAYFPQPIAQQLAHDGALEVDADALVAHERVQQLRGQSPDRDRPPSAAAATSASTSASAAGTRTGATGGAVQLPVLGDHRDGRGDGREMSDECHKGARVELGPEPPYESFAIKGEQLAAQALSERRRARAEEHSVRVVQLWKDDGGAVHVATRVGQHASAEVAARAALGAARCPRRATG